LGTVGAAREREGGSLKGVSLLAVSAAEMCAMEYEHLAIAIREIAEKVLKRKIFSRIFVQI
jgi:broad specificity polyphosphatase/5'/3'-nucleotidase SurE